MTLVFSDIHFGLKLNSEIHLKIAQDTIKWLESLIDKHQINNIIFCGDWFHQRASVSVNTMNKAYESLKSLASKVSNFYMIVGNHDSYYKNSASVNSLKVFEQFDNIKVIDSLEIVKIGQYKCGFCPWGFSREQLQEAFIDDVDLLFGHFEPSGVRVDGGRLIEFGPYSAKDLTDICPQVFSGHYHQHQTVNTKTGYVQFVGSTMQQNWGDYEEERGCIIFDESDLKPKCPIQFIENTVAPKFKKYLYSDIIKRNKLPSKSEITGNFVKIVVDQAYKFSDIQKLITKLNTASPLSVEVEYFYSEKIQYKELTSPESIKTNEDYIKDFIYGDFVEFPENIDKDFLYELSMSIYSEAKNKQE